LLLRLSELVSELPQLLEMDINPVLADEHGVVAVDARIVLHASVQAPPGQGAGNYRHLAIRPYPAQLTQQLSLRDSSLCLLRAIRPDDATLLQQLVASLSPESRYNRFAATLTELPPSLLARFTQIDYEREMALVAVRAAAADGSEPERIVGVARYTLNPGGRSAEFALLVSDAFSGQGLGRRASRAWPKSTASCSARTAPCSSSCARSGLRFRLLKRTRTSNWCRRRCEPPWRSRPLVIDPGARPAE
jgi:acetyltransferase